MGCGSQANGGFIPVTSGAANGPVKGSSASRGGLRIFRVVQLVQDIYSRPATLVRRTALTLEHLEIDHIVPESVDVD